MNLKTIILTIAGVAISACFGLSLSAQEKPNIIFIMADDLGYSDLGCYGGEIQTPVLDSLAQEGLRYSQFYNTGRCWISRTALMTGFYPQQHAARQAPPSYTRIIPHYLKPNGYRAYHSGKWHIKPGFNQSVGEGLFDRAYMSLDANRFHAPGRAKLDNISFVPESSEGNYYETISQVDYALDFLNEHEEAHSDKPFFLYLAFIAPHFPLHALPEDIAKYKDTYTVGWDKIREARWERIQQMGLVDGELSERMTDFRNEWGMSQEELKQMIDPRETLENKLWVDLTPEEQVFQAEKMAVHAAMIDRMDQEIGRLVQWLKDKGQYENTLIMFASDNGASSEFINRGDKHTTGSVPGSKESYLCLGPGWACTANTPMRYSKAYTFEGGIATPFIAHWPAAIKDENAIRTTPAHLVDILPTVARLSGGLKSELVPPQAPPFPGKDLTDSFVSNAPVDRDLLIFSHIGDALRMDDWKLVRLPKGEWELYEMNGDRAETNNVAADYPEKLQQMSQLFEKTNAAYKAKAFAEAPKTEGPSRKNKGKRKQEQK